MKKVIKLNENDIENFVKKIIKESPEGNRWTDIYLSEKIEELYSLRNELESKNKKLKSLCQNMVQTLRDARYDRDADYYENKLNLL